ncbi:MAG: GAF domain-containing protein, partial [Anaerolineae bacterium]|nr:GAF domain-containing protein [Anaerolineae bacterium]
TLTPNTPIAFYVGILFNFVTIAFFSKTTNEAMKGNILESSHHHAHLEEKNFELQKANTNLQATVNLRTEELARRTSYLEAAALVARETTSILNPDKLLDSVVDLIAEKYDFYHVGIFLVDEENQFAVLSAASSEGGKQMVARNHRLGVGKQGIVGFVTGIGQARLSQDIEKDQIHSTTEELPETRSELAVPLKIGGQIIGALDIQDNTPEAFSQDDVTTLQILADQIALAIQNARLYERAEESISEAQKLIGQFDQQSWLDSVHRGELVTYRYNSKSQLEAEKLAHGETLSQDEHGKVEIPINVRGLNIGSIDIVKEHNQAWSEDELSLLKSLSDQLGIALDSARLFSETQLRAANEHLVSDISNQVRGNLDVNSILKTTANKVRESLGLPEVTIRMAPPSESTVTNGSGQPEV